VEGGQRRNARIGWSPDGRAVAALVRWNHQARAALASERRRTSQAARHAVRAAAAIACSTIGHRGPPHHGTTRRLLVVDLDVHQGNGTAELCGR
jgi:hypothetical protein